MPNRTDKRNLLVSTAKMYYEGGLSQQEISKRIHVSRPTVSRLLKQAIREGIVQIRINDLSTSALALARQIESQYGIDHAIVAPSGRSLEESKQNVGAAAAMYLESTLANNALLAIAWGSTLGYVVKNIRRNVMKKANVIQLVGGVGNKTKDTDGNALALALADALNGDSYLLQAPFMVKSRVLKQLLMDEPHIQEHFERIRHADIALVGLGSSKPELSAQFRSGHITMEDTVRLNENGAIGDICGRYIDKEGNSCQTELLDKMIAATFDDLKQIPKVIGVASGEEKKDVIAGALKGKYINILVTDNKAALAILDR